MANRNNDSVIGGFTKNRKSRDEFYEDEFGRSNKGKKKTQKRVEYHRQNINNIEDEDEQSK